MVLLSENARGVFCRALVVIALVCAMTVPLLL